MIIQFYWMGCLSNQYNIVYQQPAFNLVQNQFLVLQMRENRKNWSPDEDQTIMNLVKKFGVKRWTLISQKMKQRFPDDGRSGKQCRQRWHNHLSPIINKQPWTQQQIKLVFDSHRKYGNKWTQIAQHLSGRTDNAVKNQFYSTLRKGLRRICKILGTRNSTTRIKKIKPTALSNLISNFTEIPIGESESQHQLYNMLFQFSNGQKYQQLKEKQVTEKYKQKMQKLLQKILDSKDAGKKRRNKSIMKQCNKVDQKQQDKIKQKIEQPKQQIAVKIQPNEFEFNIDLEENDQMDEEQIYLNQQFDSKLQKPISLKRQNSLIEQLREQDKSPSFKKKSSQSQRAVSKRLNQLQVQNNENYLKNFLSKSPNFSSRMKLPTPKNTDNHHIFFTFQHQVKYQDTQKCLNNIIQQTRHKIEKGDKQRKIR